jgi:phosphoribosyl-ATP pyrophosphohydrolase/phosphoribosyl-AMP cyclohydrolase
MSYWKLHLFYRDVNDDGTIKDDSQGDKAANDKSAILQELYDVIADRRVNPKEGSYTNYLFDKGLDKYLRRSEKNVRGNNCFKE